jgi:hypothetical protein
MNAIVPIGSSGIVPQGFDEATRLAKAMSSIKSLPKHLHDDIGTCLMVVDQAMRWRMSPFAVAQESANISGKMMYSGKLMAAAVESMGAIQGGFDYQFEGEGDDRTITVRAIRTGEHEPREMRIRLGDVKTDNAMWKKQPDQQLVYSGSRNWARRWTPAALLGAYAPEEFDRSHVAPEPVFTGTTVEHEPPVETKDEEPPVSDARAAINRDIPLRAAAASMPRGDRISEPVEPAGEVKLPPYRDFLRSLEIAIRDCGSIYEVNRLIARPETQQAMKSYKDDAKARLDAIIASGIAAHAPAQTQEPPDGPPEWPGDDEVEIAGADKMAAGD